MVEHPIRETVLTVPKARLLHAARTVFGVIINIADILFNFYHYFHIAFLLTLLFLLSLAGGYIFVFVEVPVETAQEHIILTRRQDILTKLQCTRTPAEIEARLDLYENKFNEAVNNGLSFSDGKPNLIWEISNAIYFCITTFTIVGYGEIAPKTNLGRVILMIYMGVSIPINSLVLDVISKKVDAVMIYTWHAFLEILALINYIFLYRNKNKQQNNRNSYRVHRHVVDELCFDGQYDDSVTTFTNNTCRFRSTTGRRELLHKSDVISWSHHVTQLPCIPMTSSSQAILPRVDIKLENLASQEVSDVARQVKAVLLEKRPTATSWEGLSRRMKDFAITLFRQLLYTMMFRYLIGDYFRRKIDTLADIIITRTKIRSLFNKNNSADRMSIALTGNVQDPQLANMLEDIDDTEFAMEEAKAAKGEPQEDRVNMLVHFFALAVYVTYCAWWLHTATVKMKNDGELLDSLNPLECTWFLVIAFTTAGYGDLVPEQTTHYRMLPQIFFGICIINNVVSAMMFYFNEVTDNFKLSAVALQDWINSKNARTIMKRKKRSARRNWLILKTHVMNRNIPKKLVDESLAYKRQLMANERDFIRRAYRIYFYEIFKNKFKDEMARQLRSQAKRNKKAMKQQKHKLLSKQQKQDLGIPDFEDDLPPDEEEVDKDMEDMFGEGYGSEVEEESDNAKEIIKDTYKAVRRKTILFIKGPGSVESQVFVRKLTLWQRFKRWVKKTYFKGKEMTQKGWEWTRRHLDALMKEFKLTLK